MASLFPQSSTEARACIVTVPLPVVRIADARDGSAADEIGAARAASSSSVRSGLSMRRRSVADLRHCSGDVRRHTYRVPVPPLQSRLGNLPGRTEGSLHSSS